MTGEVIQFPNDETNKKIYHLKRAGESFTEIAERLNMEQNDVIRRYRHYMVDIVTEFSVRERDHIVAMELDRLDQLMIPFWVAGTEGDKEGAETYLKIAAHRSKLLRLDQPTPDELSKSMQVIVVSGSKADYEEALRRGREMPQVTGSVGDDDGEEEAK